MTALLAATLASPLTAQSRGKVLTPPKPADTTRAVQPARPSATPPAPGAAAPGAARPPVVVPQSPVLDSIREVVFRNLLERDRAGFATLASAFCLALSNDDFKKQPSGTPDRIDPSDAMVRRLATPRAPARRASTCTFAPNGQRPVTGRALLYTVGAIDLSSPDRVEAAAGYTYDGYSAGGYTFTVERDTTGWAVKQWRMEWTAKPTAP